MDIDRKKKLNMILCLIKKKVPEELIKLLFYEWKIGEQFCCCVNIYCSNIMMIRKRKLLAIDNLIYSTCSDYCDVQFIILYMMENNINFQKKIFLGNHVHDLICKLSDDEKQKLSKIYPGYASNYFVRNNYVVDY